MILLDVKKYIKEKKFVNLQELSLHFQRGPDTMRDMLDHWLRKGVVCKASKPSVCGTQCVQCKPSMAEVYCWCDVVMQPMQDCY